MSTLRAGTVADAAGTGPVALTGQAAARAHIFFEMVGTAAIYNDLNYASLTDSGTGFATFTFTNNFINALWSGVGSAMNEGVDYVDNPSVGTRLSSGHTFRMNDGVNDEDCNLNDCAIFGDLS